MTQGAEITDRLPEIRLWRSICAEYGHCWSASAPYYSGHYRTKEQAASAAYRLKRTIEQSCTDGENGQR